MKIDQFIKLNGVRKADAIIVRKKILGLLSHYVIYLGRESEYEQDGRSMYKGWGYDGHIFMANMGDGVHILREGHLNGYLKYLEPNKINRFQGNDWERAKAIERALMHQDEKSYNLILNNCEHFANFVQEGRRYSKQSQNAGLALGAILLLGLGAALFSGSSNEDDDYE